MKYRIRNRLTRKKPRKVKFNKVEKKNYFPEPCTDDMSFQDCELAILRQAVDENQDKAKKSNANSDEVKEMIVMVEEFLRETKCICYGGTAINNILPEEAQFYDRDVEIPDYDFFSETPLAHAKELADRFHAKGYSDVEAKAGVHFGTYKVFVNFIPMADITALHPDLYKSIQKDAITIDGILYTPPNYLRMSMFLELSRPSGDVSRWEKVLKRLTLLNQYYPLKAKECHTVDFQRELDSANDSEKLHYAVRDAFIEQQVVFFGGYATSLYSRYMKFHAKRAVMSIPDFDVLHEDPEKCANFVQQRLKEHGFTKSKIILHHEVGEVVPMHYEIRVGEDTLGFVYKPIACHNYNEIHLEGKAIRVATIDTMLSFYLAFLYTDHNYFSQYKERLLCMAQYLFDVEQKNRLSQMGLLKRFSMTCYGTQPTLESMRAEKAEMFAKLKNKRTDPLYEAWFLKYNPGEKGAKKKGKTVEVVQKSVDVKSALKSVKKESVEKSAEKSTEKSVRKSVRKAVGVGKKKKTKTEKKVRFGEYLF